MAMPSATGSRIPQAAVPGFGLATLAGRIALAILGEGRLDTAADNAWQAVCADRERAAARAQIRELLRNPR